MKHVFGALLLVSACGPAPVVVCETVAGPIEVDFAASCAAVARNAERAWEGVRALGLSPVRPTAIRIRDLHSLWPDNPEIGGETFWDPLRPHVDLSRDGRSLLHEALHVLEGRVTGDHVGWKERGWLDADLTNWHLCEDVGTTL